MMISLRNVKPTDLEQLLRIENEGFPIEEAATKEVFIERIQMIANTFIVADKDGEILGFINGPVINQPYITDDLFTGIKRNPKRGGYQSVLGLAVCKKARNQGVGGILLKKMEDLVKVNDREGMTLTCKKELVPFYEKKGFISHGLSESKHGGVSWYNMVKLREKMK
jgi:ribosomal protein S18 acetylase RimI-like enzyme